MPGTPDNPRDAARQFWYAQGERYYQAMQHVLPGNGPVHALSNVAFEAGAKWMLQQTSALSPHIARFIDLLILLGVRDETEYTASDSASDRTPTSADSEPNRRV